MQRTKWTARKFTFDAPEGWIFNVLERLLGTPARLRELCKGLDAQQLTAKPADGWSLQEHVGHLLDLEALHEGRVDDFLAKKDVLRAADMSNAATYAADHNAVDLEDLLEKFAAARARLVHRLAELPDEIQVRQALHPRLQTPMRPIDMAIFTAEHDDHHLATMRAIRAKLT